VALEAFLQKHVLASLYVGWGIRLGSRLLGEAGARSAEHAERWNSNSERYDDRDKTPVHVSSQNLSQRLFDLTLRLPKG
jgi:hypothetical protein